MTECLAHLNKIVQNEKFSILLFMDNAKFHPTNNIYNNVKFMILPTHNYYLLEI